MTSRLGRMNQETSHTHGQDSRDTSADEALLTALFRTDHISDLEGLTLKILKSHDHVSTYIRETIQSATRELLEKAVETNHYPDYLRVKLVQELNFIITRDKNLYSLGLFRDIRLSGRTRKHLASKPAGKSLVLLNRMLITDAYPREISYFMHFLEHLDALRAALTRSAIGLLIALVVMYYFAPQIQELLLHPFKAHEHTMLSLITPTEGFIVRLKIALIAGLFVSSGWIFYQLWRFIAEGLYPNEKKMVLPVAFFSTICFISGAVFAWFVQPFAIDFFLSFSSPLVENMWSLGKTVDFILRMFLAFGVVFELPVIIYFLARFGIVTPEILRKYRRHAYVIVLIAAAVITPPDVFTQVVLALPMVVLYEFSIFLAIMAYRKWEKGLA